MRTPVVLFAFTSLLLCLGCGGDSDSDTSPSSDTTTPPDTSPADVPSTDLSTEEVDTTQPDTTVPDTTPIIEPDSSEYFLFHTQPQAVPGRFPASACDALTEHHTCVSTAGCGWLRTIKDDGVCRADPIARCLADGECVCDADNFHGQADYNDDLELFVPLSVLWQNMAPRTSSYTGGEDHYTTTMEMEPIVNESMANFTSRTDFTYKALTVHAVDASDAAGITDAQGLTLTLKLMPVWDKAPEAMGGLLFEGLGLTATVADSQLFIAVDGGATVSVAGENPLTGGLKDYQCNQLTLVVPPQGDATVHLGDTTTPLPGVNMATVKSSMESATNPLQVLRVGTLNAKIWDLRLYTQGRQLTAEEIRVLGKRCGSVGDYAIPDGYPDSNERYSWGMGGYKIVYNHAQQHFASGVYATMWIPGNEDFPAADPVDRDNAKRMIGFWDRWHEQMFFELDMIPFTDTRQLAPEGSLNTYRYYPKPLCEDADGCGERINYNNPCRYVTDLFQGFNWLPEDFPDEPTSADHRKIAEAGGWTRWATHDPDLYGGWQRPVHEHGHSAHFTLMRTYQKVHHYIRGISGESFAEIMTSHLFAGIKSWMSTGLTYYPTIPLAFEGRWDPSLEKHVFKSEQPYQKLNIDDQGLGARFYGLGVWWTFVSHYAAKPYLIGRLSGDSDLTPGTTLQKMRFYLAQEGLDLGDLFGNYAAHVATWDWPHIGHFLHQVEQDPFQGIGNWCTQNSGPDCTIDWLKIQADVPPDVGTNGEWVDSPTGRDPGGFAYSTVRIAGAPAGSLYEISLQFDVPKEFFPGTDYAIGVPSYCQNDARFFSSRIVVVEAGTEGQEDRPNRPQYYKIPGRQVDKVIVRVPEGKDANIYLLAVPTPPFELEDVAGFVNGYSITWPYQYKVTRLAELPADASVQEPILLDGDETLSLTPHEGNGFLFDCYTD
jgi:hypothetical protein